MRPLAAVILAAVWAMAMTGAQQEFVVHQDPAWREHANFIISAELPEKDRPKRFEQLWARQVADARFEVCCIPFFVFDLALGDMVATSPRGGRKYVVEKVVEPSGRYVFRVWFESHSSRATRSRAG